MDIMKRLRTERVAAFGPTVLRVLIGIHLIWGTQDNLLSWDRMIEFRDFLEAHGFPFPVVCAVVSVVAQFACGFLYVAGFAIRVAAAVMLFNFTVALLAVHLGGGYLEAFGALVMWTASLSLLLTGPGAWSVEGAIRVRRTARAD